LLNFASSFKIKNSVMKNGTILALGAAGLAVWYFGFGPGKIIPIATSEASPNLQPGANLITAPPGSGNLMVQAPASQTAVSIPVPGANANAVTGTNPNATLAQQQTIFTWANSMKASDQAAFYAAWPEMTSSDISGLMDLIVNEWQGGQPVTPARTLFWNTWRQTYGIDV
jgi:hypothetical protein